MIKPHIFMSFCASLCVILFIGSPVFADPICKDFKINGKGVPVNRSMEVPRNEIEQQIQMGCDPHCTSGDFDWCPNGGTRRGSLGAGGAGITTNVSKTEWQCPASRKRDSTCQNVGGGFYSGEGTYPSCTGKPGGKSVAGASGVCFKGTGSQTVGLEDIPIIPDCLMPFDNNGNPQPPTCVPPVFTPCLTNFLAGVTPSASGSTNGTSTTGTAGLTGNGFSANASGTINSSGQACASGSISFCGISAAGSICTSNQNGGTATAGQATFVELNGPAAITFGLQPGQIQDPVVATTGGTLANGQVIQAGQILSVVNNVLTVFAAGTDANAIITGQAQGTAIIDLSTISSSNPPQTIKLNITGTALIPASTVTAP